MTKRHPSDFVVHGQEDLLNWGYLHDPYVPFVFLTSRFGGGGNSYRKISGDTCSGGDVEARLEGELVPCPLAGKTGSLYVLPSRVLVGSFWSHPPRHAALLSI